MSDRSKLPKWAQQELSLLESNVAYWKDKAQAGPDDSDTFADHITADSTNLGKPLGKGTSVRFWLTDGRKFSDPHIDVRRTGHGGDYIEISSNEALEIQPHSSNVFKARMGEWW